MSKKNQHVLSDKDYLEQIKSQKKIIASLKKKQKELENDQYLFNILLNNLPDAIYFKNKKSQFIRASQHHVDYLRQKSEKDLVGKTDFDFFKEDHAEQGFSDEQEIIKTGRPIINFEEEEYHPDGRHTWVSSTKMPLIDKKGDIIGTYGISRDITETKMAKEESKAKELFIANMSHEIRTPINAIVGLTRVLQKTNIDVDQKKYLEVINTSCQNLSMIINDILDLSKLNVQKISLNPENFRLQTTINMVLASFQDKVAEKGIELRHNINANVPAVLFGDALRLNQILLNLLGNAIKFTSKGYVSLTCNLIKYKNELNYIEFEVRDTGIGMKDTSLIFDKFEQEISKTSGHHEGTGLGLAISDQLIQLFGGDITVSSEYNVGSVFKTTIPFKSGSGKLVKKQTTATQDFENDLIRGKRVLLVDDHDINRFVAETVLDSWGLEVHHAVNGKECISKLQEGKFDIVLMDLRMPVMDGLQATKYIRNGLKSNIPIVAMTANTMQDEQVRCLNVGMNDYISKPFDPDKLLEIIVKLTLREEKRNVTTNKNRKPKAQTEERLYDLTYLNKVFHDDPRALQEKVLEPFLAQMPEFIQEIKNCFKEKRISELKHHAHNLISSIHTFKIEKLYTLIRSMEKIPEDYDDKQLEYDIHVLDDTMSQVITQLKKNEGKIQLITTYGRDSALPAFTHRNNM